MAQEHPKTGKPRKPKAIVIGQRIASARDRVGCSQAALALKIRVTPGAVAQYETGRNLPGLSKLEQIALALDVAVEWLLTGDEPDELIKAQTKNEERVLRAARGLPAELQDVAAAMIEAMTTQFRKK